MAFHLTASRSKQGKEGKKPDRPSFEHHRRRPAMPSNTPCPCPGLTRFDQIAIFPSETAPIRPKLKINPSNDVFEQQADQVARQVVHPSSTQAPFKTSLHQGAAKTEVPSGFNSRLKDRSGQGSPLPGAVRSPVEEVLQRDLSDVRVHTSAEAASLNRQIRSRAFTYGNHVFFNQHEYQPGTASGKYLLTHELAHVAQDQPSIQRTPDEEEAKRVRQLKSDIAAAYGLKSVEDGDKNWTSAELTLTQQALALIPPADKPALKNVVLKRVISLGGKTAGQFSSSQSVTGDTVTSNFMIELADLTFNAADDEEKKRLIAHEIGHALASQKKREATLAHHTAMAASNKKVDEANAAVAPFNTATDEMNAVVDAQKEKLEEIKAASVEEKPALQAEFEALKKEYATKKAVRSQLETAMNAKKAEQAAAEAAAAKKEKEIAPTQISATDLASLKTTAQTAKTAHDTASANARKAVTETMTKEADAATYYEAVKAASTAIDDFYAQTKDQDKSESEVEALVAGVDRKIQSRDSTAAPLEAKNPAPPILSATSALVSAQNTLFEASKAHSLAHERTKRVQDFVKFVEANKIDPITPYARENWPHKPEEFYAEAYSYWVSKKLAAVSAKLDKWFTDGNYKK